jgi:hypothetical protein
MQSDGIYATVITFSSLNCIIILVTFVTGSEWKRELWDLVKQNADSNFFLDEVPVKASALTTSDLNLLSSKVSADSYLWIACQSHQPPSKRNLIGKFLALISFLNCVTHNSERPIILLKKL